MQVTRLVTCDKVCEHACPINMKHFMHYHIFSVQMYQQYTTLISEGLNEICLRQVAAIHLETNNMTIVSP
jgi:uncharacterized membrane protein